MRIVASVVGCASNWSPRVGELVRGHKECIRAERLRGDEKVVGRAPTGALARGDPVEGAEPITIGQTTISDVKTA